MKAFAAPFVLSAVFAGCPGTENGGAPKVVSFIVSPATVTPGGQVDVSWDTHGARTVEVYEYPSMPDGTEAAAQVFVAEGTQLDGSSQETVFRTTRFVIVARGDGEATADATVTVSGTYSGMEITNLFLEPTTVGPDDPATLQWVTAGPEGRTVTLESRPRRVPAVDWEDPQTVELSGERAVSALETTEYRLTVSDGTDSIHSTTTLTVFGPRPVRPKILTFTSTPAEIEQGESSLLEWTTQDADRVFGIPGVLASTVNGSQSVAPSTTTQYTLTAERDGFLDIAEVTVVVHRNPNAPTVESFMATPSVIGQGATATLSWDTTNVNSVDIEPSVVAGGSADGAIDVSPDTTTDYFLTATGPLGEAEASLTITVVPVGGLVISEILDDPANVSDAVGEWVEIYNSTAEDFFLSGLELDVGAASHIVAGALAVASHGYAVVGGEDDFGLNGGASVDYQWSGISLGDAETVALQGGSVTIDSVTYDAAWPSSEGTSMSLFTPDAVSNDSSANWCASPNPYGGAGNYGTPGLANDCP
jgi:lamin tail-like protein